MLTAVTIILTASVLAFVLLVRDRDLPEEALASPVEHLEQRRAVIYDNLRDLNFEYRLGKLSDADYAKTKLTLQNELAHVMGEIERILGSAPAPVAQPAAPTAANLCPHCGAKFDRALKFCGECGKPMTEAN